jgi:hypothetical protein
LRYHQKRQKRTWIKRIGSYFADFLSAAPGALKNHLNTEELLRIVVTALGAGGGVFTVFEAVLRSTGRIFPVPSDAAFAAVLLATILEARRRLEHGTDLRNELACRRVSR